MNNKVYKMVINGQSDNNISYSDFQKLIIDLGFEFQRQEGSHRIYRHPIFKVNMNIQPEGNKAKGYQVRQLRIIIKKYHM